MDQNDSNKVFSRMVKAGQRTYFVDVKEAKNKSRYMLIVESRVVDKNKFNRSSIMVFKDKMKEFLEALSDAYQVAA